MAARDPEKTARNKKVSELTTELKTLLPSVLSATEAKNELSLHAYFATRKATYIDLKHEVISSAEQYISLFVEGLLADLPDDAHNAYGKFYSRLIASDSAKKYLYIFLHRTYLREYENLVKCRPRTDDAAIWIGQNNANYGIFVTPRFRNGIWSNDNSEIRRFKPRYWSIGHVLQTGLVIPDVDERVTFSSIDEYLKFFEHVLVRHAASAYQRQIATLYSQFVRRSTTPEDVLLLLPELRYGGKEAKHEYRLDFCIIDTESGNKVGFELSPWSSHGALTGTKLKTQKQINEEGAANFDREMKKHKAYFRRHGIFTLIYSDSDLADISNVFSDIQKYLIPQKIAGNLQFCLLSHFFG